MHGVMRVIIMWDIHNTSGEGTVAFFFLFAWNWGLSNECDRTFSSHRMKIFENVVGLADNIESVQYTATSAGIWLNFCIAIKLNERILFSELRIGSYRHNNAITSSRLSPEMNPRSTCGKSRGAAWRLFTWGSHISIRTDPASLPSVPDAAYNR